MAEYHPGQRVLVDISAGILPDSEATPDWQPGVVEERLETGWYRVRLDRPVGGREAVKEAAPEHIRPAAGATSAAPEGPRAR
jgi:hypothetical protein